MGKNAEFATLIASCFLRGGKRKYNAKECYKDRLKYTLKMC